MIRLTFLQSTPTWLITVIMFILILIFNRTGYYIRSRRVKKIAEFSKFDSDAISATLFGLLSLLLAFTFGMSNARYDIRKNLIIEEANDIGTATLRADLYPDSIRELLRNNFKEYVEARIAFYQTAMDIERTVYYYMKADSIGKVIWNIATTDTRENKIIVRSGQMIPALNAMIDITTTRRAAGEATIPDLIMYFLFTVCLSSAFLLGYGNKGKTDPLLILGLAAVLSITLFTIIDLDRPRSGFIHMDVQNQKIIELREMFKVKN